MKISKLIEALKTIQAEVGDIEVYYFPYDSAKASPMDLLGIRDDLVDGEKVVSIGDE